MSLSLTKMIRNGLSASAFALATVTMVAAVAPMTAQAQDNEEQPQEGRQFGAKAGALVSEANELTTAKIGRASCRERV